MVRDHSASLAQPTHPPVVLVADDDVAITRVVARTLTARGMTVRTVGDGSTAAALASVADFDVIVSDISMPGMDGIALLRHIRSRDFDVPVIFLTADTDVRTAARAMEYGAYRYLPKPFTPDALVAAVESATKVHSMARIKRELLESHAGAWRAPGDRSALNASLDRAIGGLSMAFQPIVAADSERVAAYEALVRSNEPSLPHPGALCDAAERASRLHELSRAIRRLVAESIASCPAPDVFVNLHPNDLLDDHLYSSREPLLAHAKRVVLEVTERAALDSVDDLEARVAALRDAGFRLAVDDLGAGYSGLTSFVRLEPEIVKLDMSLIRGIDRESTKQRLVAAMTTLCRDMNRIVVAEGVETESERTAVIACGCERMQGYLFARPGPAFPAVIPRARR